MSKTNPPEHEAQSHKPTFGSAAEKPGTEQREPEGDPTTTEKEARDHDTNEMTKETLQQLQDEQAEQINPDEVQKQSHQPTTEDATVSPSNRPVTVDPDTGQIHYSGDEAPLPGGTVQHEGD